MTNQTNPLDVRLQAMLKERGWTPSEGSALASREYPTAVGMKQALIYLYPAQEGHASLQADYWSEGRNALSTAYRHVRDSLRDDELSRLVDAYLAEVDAQVAETYAARLLRQLQESKES